MEILRSWLEIDGLPTSCARQAEFDGRTVLLEFSRRSPEFDAIAQGRRFSRDGEFHGLFECQLIGGSGKLKPLGSYSLDKKDLETLELRAYYLMDEDQAVTLSVVPELTGAANEIQISPDGKTVKGSARLSTKTIKVRCTYKNVVLTSAEAIESLLLRLIVLDEGKIFYWAAPGKISEIDKNARKVQIEPEEFIKQFVSVVSESDPPQTDTP